jgi:hypothetical protein
LVQLQCLFHTASRRGYGVMVWQDPSETPGASPFC